MTQLDNLCNWFSLSIFNNIYMCLKIRCDSMKSFVLKTKKGINVSLQALSLSLSLACSVPAESRVRPLYAGSVHHPPRRPPGTRRRSPRAICYHFDSFTCWAGQLPSVTGPEISLAQEYRPLSRLAVTPADLEFVSPR